MLHLLWPAPPGLAAPTAITTGVRARPKVIESDTPRSTLSKVDEGPSKTVLQAAQDVCDHLARMASRVSDLFDEFDVDKNGLINKKEFRTACVSLGMTYPTAVLDQVFDLMDEDGSSQLEHNEVVRKAPCSFRAWLRAEACAASAGASAAPRCLLGPPQPNARRGARAVGGRACATRGGATRAGH